VSGLIERRILEVNPGRRQGYFSPAPDQIGKKGANRITLADQAFVKTAS
jgi:hypothetical protein